MYIQNNLKIYPLKIILVTPKLFLDVLFCLFAEQKHHLLRLEADRTAQLCFVIPPSLEAIHDLQEKRSMSILIYSIFLLQ